MAKAPGREGLFSAERSPPLFQRPDRPLGALLPPDRDAPCVPSISRPPTARARCLPTSVTELTARSTWVCCVGGRGARYMDMARRMARGMRRVA